MSDALVAELQRQIADKDGQIKDLRDENAKRRKRGKELETQVATLTTERDTANGKVTDLEQQVGKAPADAQSRIDELTSEVRSYKHKSVFRDKASEAGVDPKAIDVLWRESGYKADADDVSEDAITEAIGNAKESHPFLFRAATDEAAPPTPPRAPLGHDRGLPPAAGVFRVKESQLADPAWKQANQTAFNEAGRKGTLQVVAG